MQGPRGSILSRSACFARPHRARSFPLVFVCVKLTSTTQVNNIAFGGTLAKGVPSLCPSPNAEWLVSQQYGGGLLSCINAFPPGGAFFFACLVLRNTHLGEDEKSPARTFRRMVLSPFLLIRFCHKGLRGDYCGRSTFELLPGYEASSEGKVIQ